MEDLLRIYGLRDALRGSKFEAEAARIAEACRIRAHSFPRGKLGNYGRRLRNMCREIGVWAPGLGC